MNYAIAKTAVHGQICKQYIEEILGALEMKYSSKFKSALLHSDSKEANLSYLCDLQCLYGIKI